MEIINKSEILTDLEEMKDSLKRLDYSIFPVRVMVLFDDKGKTEELFEIARQFIQDNLSLFVRENIKLVPIGTEYFTNKIYVKINLTF